MLTCIIVIFTAYIMYCYLDCHFFNCVYIMYWYFDKICI